MVKRFLVRAISGVNLLKNVAWHEKSACDILLFDAMGSDAIRHCLPTGAKVNVLRVREGLPLIKSSRFFLLLFMNLCKYRRPKRALVATLVNIWQPKIVITFIDNAASMGNIKSLFPDIQCISVQNGIRWDLSRPLQPHLSFDHYFCFGEVEGDILRQAALPVAHRYPIGSLKAGIFWAQHPPQKNKEFDLCFISHFELPQDIHTDQWAEEMSIAYNETGKSVFRQVANFSAKKNLTLCVAMRFSLGSAGYKEEKNYYTHSNNGQVHFIPQSPYSSYKATQASRLSVTCSSTLGYEALGMGERVIFAKDIEEIASIVLKGPWKTNLVTHRLPDLQRLYSASGEEFYAKAQLLLAMTDEDYLKYSESARAYYMCLDKNNLPQAVIKNKIQLLLLNSY